MELKLPLDFERMPQVWALTEALRTGNQASGRPMSQSALEQVSALMYVRLFVLLGYLARTTEQVGWLTPQGIGQFNASWDQFNQEDDPPHDFLVRAGIVERTEQGLYCAIFASTNAHLGVNYVSPSQKGNRRSAIIRSKNNMAAQALQQGMLLAAKSPERLRKRNGDDMAQPEIERTTRLITMLDRVLGLRARPTDSFTAGMLADACDITSRISAESLEAFYLWLTDNRDNAAFPETTELILRDWDNVFALQATL